MKNGRESGWSGAEASRNPERRIKKRVVFYLSGYDPRGARHYHGLYRREATKQGRVNGKEFQVSSRKRTGAYRQSWRVESLEKSTGLQCETDYHFLEWDDLIRTGWKKTPFELLRDLIYYVKIYLIPGLFIRYIRPVPRQQVSFFYPIVYLAAAFFLSLWIASGLFEAVEDHWTAWGASAVALLGFYAGMRLFLYFGSRYAVFWLLRIFVFSAKYAYEMDRALEKRLEEFASYLAEEARNAEKKGVDEILFVSHSVGTILTIPVLEKFYERMGSARSPDLSVMTLGECIPLVSGIPKAETYREQMRSLARRRGIHWVDYTTAIDGACFPQFDFFRDAGVREYDRKRFLFRSPRFHTLFSQSGYRRVRRNKYRAHFVYLLAVEKSGGYDYFEITAGNTPFASHTQRRKQS